MVLKEWNTSEWPSQEGFGHLSWRAQGPWARSRGAGRVSYPQGKSRRERPREGADPDTHPVYLDGGPCGSVRVHGHCAACLLPAAFPRGQGSSSEGGGSAQDHPLTLGHSSSGEPQHAPHISSLFDKCDCFSVPRGPGPSHLELSCIIRLHHLVRRGQFPSAFLNVSPHPNIRTPACTIQHFSVYKHHS